MPAIAMTRATCSSSWMRRSRRAAWCRLGSFPANSVLAAEPPLLFSSFSSRCRCRHRRTVQEGGKEGGKERGRRDRGREDIFLSGVLSESGLPAEGTHGRACVQAAVHPSTRINLNIEQLRKRKETENAIAHGRRCSEAVEVSPHKKRSRLFFSQSNTHAQVNGPQDRVFP